MKNISILIVIGIVSICMHSHAETFPTYKFGAGEKKAYIKLVSTGLATMCKDKVIYDLDRNKEFVEIPAGELIHIGSFLAGSVTNYNGVGLETALTSCNIVVGLIPKDGITYVANGYIFGTKCYAELVREDVSQLVGINFEESLRAPNSTGTCYKPKPIK